MKISRSSDTSSLEMKFKSKSLNLMNRLHRVRCVTSERKWDFLVVHFVAKFFLKNRSVKDSCFLSVKSICLCYFFDKYIVFYRNLLISHFEFLANRESSL